MAAQTEQEQYICTKDKKNIFLIGDSIRIGYCEGVREKMADQANVFYVPDNCRNTQYVIIQLQAWLLRFENPEMVDAVHFNCGHWDAAHWCGAEEPLTSLEEYEKNLKMIIWLLRKFFVNAKIFFATTTPMNPNGNMGGNPRTTQQIREYNRVAEEICAELDVPANDLFDFTCDWDSTYFKDYCHFTEAANGVLSSRVADWLMAQLP